jgi:hypothetical protein
LYVLGSAFGAALRAHGGVSLRRGWGAGRRWVVWHHAATEGEVGKVLRRPQPRSIDSVAAPNRFSSRAKPFRHTPQNEGLRSRGIAAKPRSEKRIG